MGLACPTKRARHILAIIVKPVVLMNPFKVALKGAHHKAVASG